MASSLLQLQLLLLSFSCLSPISHAHISCRSTDSVVIPVAKHASSHHYLSRIRLGNPPVSLNLVVDLGRSFVWADCSSLARMSSSRRSFPCRSIQCSTANAHDYGSGSRTCGHRVENKVTREMGRGELTEDILAVEYEDLSKSNPISTVQLLHYCTNNPLFTTGLPTGVNGVLGLGRARISVPSQLAMTLGLARKFSVCLSPSSGHISIGKTLSRTGLSKSLTYTPLVSTNSGNRIEDYFISVTSIRINSNHRIEDIRGGTEISTVEPYTVMESRIYEEFIKVYTKVAASMNMTRVATVVPFGVCYNFVPTVPNMELVLQSEMVKWKISGRNLMVRVSEEVICLGFLDGGSNPNASIVLGVHQLEDQLLEFNFDTKMLGFSTSLMAKHTTCSNLRFYSS